jgi:uncharacterized protein YegP (UPF0339 family)
MSIFVFKVYKGVSGEWRWTISSEKNGKIVGASTEGYKKRADVFKNVNLVCGWSKEIFEEVNKSLFTFRFPG